MGSVHLHSREPFKFAAKTKPCAGGNPGVFVVGDSGEVFLPPVTPPWSLLICLLPRIGVLSGSLFSLSMVDISSIP